MALQGELWAVYLLAPWERRPRSSSSSSSDQSRRAGLHVRRIKRQRRLDQRLPLLVSGGDGANTYRHLLGTCRRQTVREGHSSPLPIESGAGPQSPPTLKRSNRSRRASPRGRTRPLVADWQLGVFAHAHGRCREMARQNCSCEFECSRFGPCVALMTQTLLSTADRSTRWQVPGRLFRHLALFLV